MRKLGVNIDHVATIRNARGELYPDPYKAAIFATKSGANSITIHLREDRRHINDRDVLKITKNRSITTNLELAATKEMLKILLNIKPNYICIVPEKRKEITTEGGLNLKKNISNLKKIIKLSNNKKIRTSLFINPNINDVKKSKNLGTKCIELHTGRLCNLINKNKNYKNELSKIKKCTNFAISIGLEVHAGHGLTYKSAKIVSKVAGIKEFNIGHFIIGESVFYGLNKTIKNFKKILM
jgi:pyridoxine 5-phosphate synthase|tara:strand:+ start:275 stop:991 length:717 start_codon:yes stop_codon:yes gene_type:complete